MQRDDKARNDHPAVAVAIDRITRADGFGRQLLALLACPPNLTYLFDGLRRTLEIIQPDEGQFDRLVQPRLKCDAATLVARLESIVGSTGEIAAAVKDPERLALPMARVDERADHPFRRYCLSTSVYWSGLFYQEPRSGSDGVSKYGDFYAQLAPHFLSLTAKLDPQRYAEYMAQWAQAGGNRDATLPGARRGFHSRLSAAGLAARRLTLPEHRQLLDRLTDPELGSSLTDRVYVELERNAPQGGGGANGVNAAAKPGEASGADDPDKTNGSHAAWELLNNLGRLFVLTVPGWRRPGHSVETGPTEGGGGGGRRNKRLPDGYARISDTSFVQQVVELLEGAKVELLHDAANGETEPGESLDEGLPDDWISITEGESAGSGGGQATRTLASARQVAHVARYHQLLTLAPDAPTAAEIGKVAAWLRSLADGRGPWPQDDPTLPLAVATMFATGRSLEEVAGGLRIDDPHVRAPIAFSTASSTWRIRINGPVYADEVNAPCASEHPVHPIIELPDSGPFGRLAERFRSGAGPVPLGIQKLTGRFRRLLASTLASVAGTDHLSPFVLSRAIFRILLDVSHGDLGKL